VWGFPVLRRDNFKILGISCQNMFTDKEYHLNSTRLHLNIGRELEAS